MIPKDAMTSAKKAMEQVTPPAGMTTQEWIAEYGEYAWLAGLIAAAAPYLRAQALEDAADMLRQVREDIDPWGKPTVENYADWIAARAVTERGEGE